MTQYIPLLGYPLRHSISPVFQQAAIDYYDLDIEYQVWETNPAQLAHAVGELRYPRNLGANVTIPFKEEVLNFLDELDPVADEIGAANTIVKREQLLAGYNTDAPGFMRALREDGGFEPTAKDVVVLGAGGAARAVCYALMAAGVSRVAVANRSAERAEELVDALKQLAAVKGLSAAVSWVAWGGEETDVALRAADLIVNCTSVGMKHGGAERQSPLSPHQIPAHVLVYDLVYNPAQTPLLKAAAGAGARTLGGLPMLVYQGAAAFQLWTGKEPPLEVMFEAARSALS